MMKNTFILSVLLLAVSCSSVRADADWTVQSLETGEGHRDIRIAPDGLSVSDAAVPDARSASPTPLWRLDWRNREGVLRVVRSTEGDLKVTRVDGKWLLDWSNLRIERDGDIAVRVTVTPRSDAIVEWRLSLKADANQWRLFQWQFPIIRVPLKDTQLAQPRGWGLLYDKVDSVVTGTYPGYWAAMQWLAALHGDSYFYIAAHDPAAHYKDFTAAPQFDSNTLELSISAVPEGAGLPIHEYEIPFPIVTKAAPGDWYDAAMVYRNWAKTAPWCQAGTVHERKDIPKWLKDNTMWTTLFGTEKPLNAFRIWNERFNYPTIVHWYQWHEIPFDSLYPDYFPVKEDFPAALKEVRDTGARAVPYINGRLWCPDAPSWSEKGAINAAVLQASGEPIIEDYRSGYRLAVMCPDTQLWQDTIVNVATRIFNELDVNGIYIDQIGAAKAIPCWATNHKHPPGGGSYWADGYREMLTRIVDAAGPKRIVVTEENAECWMDLFDGCLMVNTPPGPARLIPLYPAIYADYTIPFGFQYMGGNDGMAFRLKLARAFVWGAQEGWLNVRMAEKPNAESKLAYVDAIAEAHYGYPAALTEGRFLRPPQVRNTPEVDVELERKGNAYEKSIPAVLATLWEETDGTVWLAVTNWSEERAKPRIVSSLGKLEILPAPGTGNWRSVRGKLYGTMEPGTAQLLQLDADW